MQPQNFDLNLCCCATDGAKNREFGFPVKQDTLHRPIDGACEKKTRFDRIKVDASGVKENLNQNCAIVQQTALRKREIQQHQDLICKIDNNAHIYITMYVLFSLYASRKCILLLPD